MQGRDFHYMVLSRENHRLVSADVEAYGFINHDLFTPFENYILEEDRHIFEEHLTTGSSEWMYIRILGREGLVPVYIRILAQEDTDFIKMTLARSSDVISSHESMDELLENLISIGTLYNDIYFTFDPDSESIRVLNDHFGLMEQGDHPLSEFERILMERVPDSERIKIVNFLQNMKSGIGRFREDIYCNILTRATEKEHTLIEGCTVYHHGGRDGAVGLIHIGERNTIADGSQLKRDALTGLVDREAIFHIVKVRIDDRACLNTTIGIVDVDFFKNINDTYGHREGDLVLRKVADILNAEVGTLGSAGRIGGDEFFVVITSSDETVVRRIFGNIKNLVRTAFPDMGPGGNGPLTVSIGGASYPDHASNFDDLFTLADFCLYRAKDKGRNRYIYYTPAKHGSLEEIKQREHLAEADHNDREETTPGEVICNMLYRRRYGKVKEMGELLDEFSRKLQIPNIMLYGGSGMQLRYVSGSEALEEPRYIQDVTDFVTSDLTVISSTDMIVVNTVESLPLVHEQNKQALLADGIRSVLILHFQDADGLPAMLVFTSVDDKQQTWNQLHFKYYRIFADLLGTFGLREAPLFHNITI